MNSTLFDFDASKTFIGTESYFSIMYGSGNAFGLVAYDSVSIGGHPVKNQTIGIVFSLSLDIDIPFDGVLGLGSSNLTSIENSKTVLENMVEQGVIPKNQFSFLLRHSNEQSVLSLGGYDESLIDGTMHWAPVTDVKRWTVNVDSMTVGDKVLQFSADKVLVDSGTSAITISTDAFTPIVGLLNATLAPSGNHQVECQGLPNVEFKINGVDFVVENSQYAVKDADKTIDPGKCVLAIVGQDIGFWVLGDAFMRNKLIAFDAEENRIGFGILKK